MRRHRRFVPGAWARLEERVVLSPGLAAAVGPHVAVTPQVQLDLRGTVTGLAIRTVQSTVDTWQLSGSGGVAPLGPVRAAGSLTVPHGASSPYDGQLTLVAGRGDVFVHLYRTVGGQGRYIVTGGTGLYHGATGRGAATFSPTPPSPGSPDSRVMFTLKFGTVGFLEA